MNYDAVQIIHKSSMATLTVNMHGDIVQFNEACASMLKFQPNDVIGKSMKDLLIPERFKAQHTAAFEKFQKKKFSGQIIQLPNVTSKSIKVVCLTKDKIELQVEMSLLFDEHKDTITAFLNDITNQNGKDSIFTAMVKVLSECNDFVYSKDLTGRYTNVNKAVEKYLGKQVIEIIGTMDDNYFEAAYAALIMEHDKKTMTDNKIYTFEEQIKLIDHTDILTVLSTRVPMIENDKVIGMYGMSKDVTVIKNKMNDEIIRTQLNEHAAIQASNLKSQFLSTMSHEIRTPINGIVGLSTLLSETKISGEQKEYVDGIIKSSGLLLSIINDILDFNKIESNKIDIEILDVNLFQLLNDIIIIFEIQAMAKGLKLKLINDLPSQAKYVKIDPGRVKQVLYNLLSNAIKFTSHGEIFLKVILLDNYLKFMVSDTGIGISKEVLSNLFTPFTQADSSVSRKYGGTGLGLSICKSLVALMKGCIGCVPSTNQGCLFWFTVPFTQGVLQIDQQNLSQNLSNKNDNFILVVEDNSMNLKVALKMLEKLGYKAIGACNGKEAIDTLNMNLQEFVLILTDLNMPIMNGFELTENIRNGESRYKNLPIIATTANVLKGEQERCLEMGMNDYIAKPIIKHILASTISKWLV